jgi:hypothetical protein
MKKSYEATDAAGQEILVDANDVKLNPAGTNMKIACYFKKSLDAGDRRPDYINFHHLKLDPDDRAEIEKIFQQKSAELAAKIKADKLTIRRAKKSTPRKIA